jgi:glutaredoxin 3
VIGSGNTLMTQASDFSGDPFNDTFSRRHVSSSSTAIPDELVSLIENNKVVIFSKSYCPFCTATKRLFQGMGVEGVVIVELDQEPNGTEIQRELTKMTGQHTVPNVFVSGRHLGGNSDTQAAAKTGKLQDLLK